MSEIEFNHAFEFEYGIVTRVAPDIRRIVANNPGPFTGPGTSTYIVGDTEVAVIDPGPMLPDHIDALLEGLGDVHISHILITHTHADHSPASRLLQQRTGAATFGFGPHLQHSTDPLAHGADQDFVPDFVVSDDELINGNGWSMRAIHTPGHCANHLCFAFNQQNALFCGDQLMAWSTPVIIPPDGNVLAYLHSLDQLAAQDYSVLYPTHGRPVENPTVFIEQVKQHRLRRVQQVHDAIVAGIDHISAMRNLIYPDISSRLFGGAELTLLAYIEYLVDQGMVQRKNGNPPTYSILY